MSLVELKNYLSSHQMATVSEIAGFFAADPEMVRNMLDVWMRKGKVTSHQVSKCNGCKQTCTSSTAMEVFQWQENSTLSD